jgi:hypothetical protein
MDNSPHGQLAPWTIRRIDNSPHGWLLSQKTIFFKFSLAYKGTFSQGQLAPWLVAW